MSKIVKAVKSALGLRTSAGKAWFFWVQYHHL